MKVPKKRLCCPHCEEVLLDRMVISWAQSCISRARKRPPDKEKGVPPAKEGTPTYEKAERLEPIAKPDLLQPLSPPASEEAEPSIAVFGHLRRATDIFLCQTTKDARALWETLPRPRNAYAVIALRDPKDIHCLTRGQQLGPGEN